MNIKILLQFLIKCLLNIVFIPVLSIGALILQFFGKYSKKRVFFGLMHNNNLVYVRDSLRKLGYEASMIPWIVPEHEKNIDYDINLCIEFPRLYRNFIVQQILRHFLFLWSLCNFDVFILPFRSRFFDEMPLLSFLEFQLIHLAGKKVILNPYGGDIQYPEVWSSSSDKTMHVLFKAWMQDPYYSNVETSKTKKNIRYCERHADAIIASLEWPDYLSKIDYYFHMRINPSVPNRDKNAPFFSDEIKILHATNHPHFKGTEYIKQAVRELSQSGVKCSLKILEGTENKIVLREVDKSDIVIDQLLAGAYGRLAIEAMALGKPVMCYLREDFIKIYPQWNQCPIINVNIDTLKDKILEFISLSINKRQEIEDKSKEYIEKFHSPKYVGEKLSAIIQEVVSR